jgi:hypothetical protein
MKLGVTYIVFDGIELLEHSIRQIRPHVDYVNVIYQEISWFGSTIQKEDLQTLNLLKRSNLIDDLTKFTNFSPIRDKSLTGITKAKSYERAKRQLGLDMSLTRGCTHYLCMDVDEFYISDEFAEAKSQIIKMEYVQTAVRMINYVNIPTIHRGYDSNRVPFICKITRASKMTPSFFVKCDPTRGITGGPSGRYEFKPTEITMHHMETVRKNLLLKYDSTTRAVFKRSKTNELVQSIKSVNESKPTFNFNKIIFPGLGQIKLTKCENVFDIPYGEWTIK